MRSAARSQTILWRAWQSVTQPRALSRSANSLYPPIPSSPLLLLPPPPAAPPWARCPPSPPVLGGSQTAGVLGSGTWTAWTAPSAASTAAPTCALAEVRGSRSEIARSNLQFITGPIAGNPGPQSNPRLPTTIREIIAPPTQDASAATNLLPVVQQPVEQQSDFVFPEEDDNEAFGLPSPTQQIDESRVQQNEDQNSVQQTFNDVLSNQESNEPKLSPEQLSTTSTPFVQCPSAMKCVPRVNCDFNGVMVSYNVILSQVQEQQRVPLIVRYATFIKLDSPNNTIFQPCFNTARGNSVDVCCRDPNYKDPWPEMNNSGTPETILSASQQDPQSQAPVIAEDFIQRVEKTKKIRPGYGK